MNAKDGILLLDEFETAIHTSAMDTFLLNAIAEEDVYDKKIIQQCIEFVDNVDLERRYLTNRRYITKAKFDTYFSIRTPAQQFNESQHL